MQAEGQEAAGMPQGRDRERGTVMLRRHQPPMPDEEPRPTCPLFDAAIREIESARSANAELRNIIDQWRKQAEYWEVMSEDMSSEISELKEQNDELTDRVRALEKELSAVG